MLEGIILGLHLFSHHNPNHDGQNNTNPGIYVKSQEGWTAGIYENTWERTSVYGGKTFSYAFKDGDVSLLLGGVTGYKKKKVDTPCPVVNKRYHKNFKDDEQCFEWQGFSSGVVTTLVAPSVRYEFVRLTVLPRIGQNPQVIHLSVEKKF